MNFKFDFALNKNKRIDKVEEGIKDILATGDGKLIDFTEGVRSFDKRRIARVTVDFNATYKAVIFLAKVYSVLDSNLDIKTTKSTLKSNPLTDMDKMSLSIYETNLQHKLNSISRQIDAINENTFATQKEDKELVNITKEYKQLSSELCAIKNFFKVFPNV